jgi:tetratricopeptide (TPR) repeat protein
MVRERMGRQSNRLLKTALQAENFLTVLIGSYYSQPVLETGKILAKTIFARPKRTGAFVALGTLLLLMAAASLFGQNASFEKSFNQGAQAMRAGDWNGAVSSFTVATGILPSSAEAQFNLGLAQLQQGHPQEAIPALNRAIELSPKLRGAHLFLGVARYRLNDYPAAITALRKETQIDAGNGKALMWLGVAQLAAGDNAAAAASLDKAAQLDPSDVDILYHRGRAHMLVSKQSYEEMFKADPNSWRVHQALAQSFVEADRLEDAVHECQNALNLRPQEPGLHEELADIYWNQNQLEKAEAAFQEELKVDPESVSSMYKLAVVSLERSKPEVTVVLLSRVLQQSPGYRDAHYQKGRAEAQLGQVSEAISDFKAEVAVGDRGDAESLRQSYYQLAQLYRRAQQPEESKAALEAFLRLKQKEDASQAQKLQDKVTRSAEVSR